MSTPLSYRLRVDLPDAWRQVPATLLQAARGSDGTSITPIDVLRAVMAEAPVMPAFMAMSVLPIEEVRPGLTSLLIASLVVDVHQAPSGDARPRPGSIQNRVVRDYPVLPGHRCPVFVATYAVPAQDGGAVAIASFTSPNVRLQDEFDRCFGSLAARISLNAATPGDHERTPS